MCCLRSPSVPPKKAEEGKVDKDSSKDAAEAERTPQENLAETVRDAKASPGHPACWA